MPASDEFKMVRSMAKALDARSFNLDHAAAMMAYENIETQKQAFNFFMKMMHAWAVQGVDVPEDHPLFNVYMYATRFAEDLPKEVK